eukprot:COSAG02_NODE_325_length_24616_cov_17.214667_8_plen_153_part_00
MGSVRIRVKIISIFQEKLCRNWIRRRMTQNSNRNHRIGPAGTLEVRNQPFTHQLAVHHVRVAGNEGLRTIVDTNRQSPRLRGWGTAEGHWDWSETGVYAGISSMIRILMPPSIQLANSKSPWHALYFSVHSIHPRGGGGIMGHFDGKIGKSP